MRIVLIGFVIVLLVLSCGLAVRYSRDANYAHGELNGERYERMVAEENLQKANMRISSLEGELKREQDKAGQMEVILEKTKAVNEDLKARLDKAAEIKKSLDKRIADLQQMTSPL